MVPKTREGRGMSQESTRLVQPDTSPSTVAYAGSRTTKARKATGVGLTAWVAADGPWRLLQQVVASDGAERVGEIPANPTFLLTSADQSMLYVAHGDTPLVSWLAIGPDGRLEPRGTVDVGHGNPVDLTQVGSWLVVSCLAAQGAVLVLPIEGDGGLGRRVSSFTPKGTLGPHGERQQGPNPHQAVLDPSGRWLLVPDRGHDTVWVLEFDRATGALREHGGMRTRRGEGPRHIAFHPDGEWAYVVTELRSSVLACRWNASEGALQGWQVIPSCPALELCDSCGAEIHVTRDGGWVLVSNRSGISDDFPPGKPDTDTIGVFRVRDDRTLEPYRWVPSGGLRPRFFAPTVSDDAIVIANEASGTLALLPHGADQPQVVAHVASPTCIAFGPTLSTNPDPPAAAAADR
jgi:6-phosphogluconolactonase (cycloisomerase 2 family)